MHIANQIKEKAYEIIDQNFNSSGLLRNVQSVEINQQPDFLECLCPCFGETSNTYKLSEVSYLQDKINNAANGAISVNIPIRELGAIQEKSGCCSRFFCQCWRSFELNFLTQNDSGQTPYFYARRKYKLPAVFCMPCGRPEVEVFINKGAPPAEGQDQNNLIGTLKQPYMCCGRSDCPCPLLEEIDICDKDGNMKYYITGQFCQCGFMARLYLCPRCCGPCRFIQFFICDPTQQKVGEITNIYNGCCNECYTKADKYKIQFPAQASEEEKVMIVVAALTIDYDIFEYTFFNLP